MDVLFSSPVTMHQECHFDNDTSNFSEKQFTIIQIVALQHEGSLASRLDEVKPVKLFLYLDPYKPFGGAIVK